MSQAPHDPELPLIRQIPQPSIASPADLRPRNTADVRWYRPTFSEVARLMGWQWLYFLPAFLMVLLLILMIWNYRLVALLIVSWKLAVIAVVLPTGRAINIARHILRNRKEPFCIHCGYDLTSLPDNHTCPECGEPYTFKLIKEYKRDPNWFIKRYQMHREIPVHDMPFEARKSNRPRSRDGT